MILFTESFGALDTSSDSDAYILGKWTTWFPYPVSGDPSAYIAPSGPGTQPAFLKELGAQVFEQGALGITLPLSDAQTSIVLGGYIRARENIFSSAQGLINIALTMPGQSVKESDLSITPDPDHPVTAVCRLDCTSGYGLFMTITGAAIILFDHFHVWQLLSSPPLACGYIQQDKWHFVEIKMDWSSSSIAGEVRLDDEITLPLTQGVTGDGKNLSVLSPTQIAISFSGIDFTGIYILDNLPDSADSVAASDFLGEVTIASLSPIADGDTLEWAPSTGTAHYPLVTPPPDGDATYVLSADPGAIDAYKFQMPAGGSRIIHQVAVNNVTKQVGDGVRQIAGVSILGADTQTGLPGSSLTTQYKPNVAIFTSDPSGAQWTDASLAAAEFGIVIVT